MLVRFAALAMLVSAPAHAAGFHCHVTPESPQCGLDGCSDSGTFMDITVDGRTMSFCEGEGCAEGKLLMIRDRPGTSFAYARVKRNGGTQPAFRLSLMYDRAAKVVHISADDDNRIVKCVAES